MADQSISVLISCMSPSQWGLSFWNSIFVILQLALLREQFGERESQVRKQEEEEFVDYPPGNSVINNQELADDTSARQEGRSNVHNHKINTVLSDADKQREICDNSSLVPGEAIATPLPLPPPPPPPPVLKPPTNQIRSILTNPVWMMKEITTELSLICE